MTSLSPGPAVPVRTHSRQVHDVVAGLVSGEQTKHLPALLGKVFPC